MKKNRTQIQKVPLRDFIDALVEIYNSGIESISMIVEKGDHQDSLWLIEDREDNAEIQRDVDFENLIN